MSEGGQKRPTVSFASIPIESLTPQQAVERLLVDASDVVGGSSPYRLVNAYSVVLAQRYSQYGDLLRGAGYNFCDSRPLSVVLRALQQDSTIEQVRGPSLFLSCLDQGRLLGVRHALVGASPAVLAQLADRLVVMFPGLNIVSTVSPPFRALTPDELAAQTEQIRATRPNIVWLGLGTPKQDFEAVRLCSELNLPVVGVGAAFDFAAGAKSEAPIWMRHAGLEWLFRLGTEPRRLARRYFVGNLKFLVLVAREVIRRRR